MCREELDLEPLACLLPGRRQEIGGVLVRGVTSPEVRMRLEGHALVRREVGNEPWSRTRYFRGVVQCLGVGEVLTREEGREIVRQGKGERRRAAELHLHLRSVNRL